MSLEEFSEKDMARLQNRMLNEIESMLKGIEILINTIKEMGPSEMPENKESMPELERLDKEFPGVKHGFHKVMRVDVEPKHVSKVYSNKLCLFEYCPHPDTCKIYGEGHCLSPNPKKLKLMDELENMSDKFDLFTVGLITHNGASCTETKHSNYEDALKYLLQNHKLGIAKIFGWKGTECEEVFTLLKEKS